MLHSSHCLHYADALHDSTTTTTFHRPRDNFAPVNNDIGLSKLAGTVHPYPTSQEAVRQCAAQFWQKGGLKTPVNLRVIQLLLAEKEAKDKAAAEGV